MSTKPTKPRYTGFRPPYWWEMLADLFCAGALFLAFCALLWAMALMLGANQPPQ